MTHTKESPEYPGWFNYSWGITLELSGGAISLEKTRPAYHCPLQRIVRPQLRKPLLRL